MVVVVAVVAVLMPTYLYCSRNTYIGIANDNSLHAIGRARVRAGNK